MKNKYSFSLDSLKALESSDNGSITYVTSDDAAGFVNISFASLKLQKNGSVEPMWHPDASKVGYCIDGNALISIRTPSGMQLFTVTKGDIFFIPQGYVHHILNTSEQETNFVFALNNDKPNTMLFSKAMFSLSDEVFKVTFNTSPDFLQGLKKAKKHDLINFVSANKALPHFISSPYKFNLNASSNLILTKGGFVMAGTKTNLPILNGLGVLGFGLNPNSAVEPHWHTNAGELVYVLKGKTQITVLTPEGSVNVMEVAQGQGAFAPASYFHNILNVGEGNSEIIAFFTNENPDYIGIGEVLGSYSNEVLASIFGVPPSYFDTLVKPEVPLVIVPV